MRGRVFALVHLQLIFPLIAQQLISYCSFFLVFITDDFFELNYNFELKSLYDTEKQTFNGINKMVTQNTLRMCEGNMSFLKKHSYFRLLYLNECLKQIKLNILSSCAQLFLATI